MICQCGNYNREKKIDIGSELSFRGSEKDKVMLERSS